MPGLYDQPSPSAQSHLLRGAERDPRKWRRKERRMEEPQAGRRGCSVKTMNEQRPSAGLLPVAAPLWGGAHRGPALRSQTTRSPRRQLQPTTPRQMLTRICSSFNVKTQKYPVPSSLPRPPAACSRSSIGESSRRATTSLRALSATGALLLSLPRNELLGGRGNHFSSSGLGASKETPLPSASQG